MKPGDRKLLGVKIRRQVILELKEYAKFVGQPINYCAEKLMEYGLSHEYHFQRRMRSRDRHSRDRQKGWVAFLAMGKKAASGKVNDASVRHDSYLYGRSRKT